MYNSIFILVILLLFFIFFYSLKEHYVAFITNDMIKRNMSNTDDINFWPTINVDPKPQIPTLPPSPPPPITTPKPNCKSKYQYYDKDEKVCKWYSVTCENGNQPGPTRMPSNNLPISLDQSYYPIIDPVKGPLIPADPNKPENPSPGQNEPRTLCSRSKNIFCQNLGKKLSSEYIFVKGAEKRKVPFFTSSKDPYWNTKDDCDPSSENYNSNNKQCSQLIHCCRQGCVKEKHKDECCFGHHEKGHKDCGKEKPYKCKESS